ncbi:hypothetical protein [Tranquillimonas alkanivorans]|uniref:Uncharacterized protein n=1 Tax=Tranquillimonas alkanivorans TaxID=441119 RepID=A0A1I5VCP7_9RHOB|nr:hypothetical protein [Tranquillimonas alkanivorans]SFQ05127.1 hypothetical protein SAMN04488047_12916 [Tranquillimonas alkanivorans]
MNPEMTRFFALLGRAPQSVQRCFDREKCWMDGVALEHIVGHGSSGERSMARFFRDVWKGQSHDQEPFLLIDAHGPLDRDYREIIAAWILDPCWP